VSLFWFTTTRPTMASAEAAMSRADRSEEAAETALILARRLEGRVNQLTLVNMALWSLLRERFDLTEEELVARVEEIDLRDGRLDGKVVESVVNCPNCGRTMSVKHDRCLYCGYEAPVDAFGFPLTK
jgi:hypothetical protein